MKLSQNNRVAINLVVFGTSMLMWMVLLFNPGEIMTMEHCHVSSSGPSAKSLEMLLEMNPVSGQLIGWGLMVVAMMLPKLLVPIQGIYIQSLKRFRFVCATLFVLGYLGAWMVAGVFLVAIIIGFNLWLPMSFIPALCIGLVALVWQFSPIKQRFLNLGHDHRNLPAFGWPALTAALEYGVMHGVWCIGAGWALMLFPMLLPQGHNVAMLLVTFIMLSEHMENPKYPKWNFNLRLRLFKIIVAQTKIKLTAWLF
jgi:predicted metal-binding membrane protein